MIEVDAMGKVCPIPVIMTKKAIRENVSGDSIVIKVDNEVATQNLAKMAAQMKIKCSVQKMSAAEYTVLYEFENCEACTLIDNHALVPEETGAYTVVISSQTMGQGDESFGKKLLENFVYALTEQDVIPERIVLYNGGVRLASENEKTIADLKKLQEKGCEILACGLCLDFYGLKEKLQVGAITNMYRIVEIMRTHKTVQP
ncbi:MAG: sulfurtransferase-like selenium metabolism protein YedF [Treponema sp.]